MFPQKGNAELNLGLPFFFMHSFGIEKAFSAILILL